MNLKKGKLSELAGRFIKVIDTMGYSGYKIAKEADGISQPVITHIRKGRNEPSLKVIIALLKLFPEVNPSWLLTGRGTMLLKDNSSDLKSKSKSVPGAESMTPGDIKAFLKAKDTIIAVAEKLTAQNQRIIEYFEEHTIKETLKQEKETAKKGIAKSKN